MLRVIYTCVDCGKQSLPRYPSSFGKGITNENYRCKDCTLKKHNQNRISKKVTYVCIDCGKTRTACPSSFTKPREEYRCNSCTVKKRVNTPEEKEIRRNRMLKKMQDPIWKENQIRALKESVRNIVKDEEYYKKRSDSMKLVAQTPEWRKRVGESTKNAWKDPTHRENYINGFKKRSENPEWRKNISEQAKIRYQDPNFIEIVRNSALKRFEDPIKLEWYFISTAGEGFWYGHASLRRWNNEPRKYYCELWNNDLRNRIDAAWDFKSAISGKTRFENYKHEKLCKHHIYWQEKACCYWDEDINGYYAWINNGMSVTPEWIKYYIKGDPNKFVPLTRKEHGMVRGDKKLGTDKIYWIKHFENQIEQRGKEGKKCYLSPEEYGIYKIEHSDTIAKYNQKST